ncbi:MAG: 30S ribosomal protein S9 [Nocardiopsaceae bacterium]|nr:30S ribosomal protein S9 [Nocardiopsaceae bacterium]
MRRRSRSHTRFARSPSSRSVRNSNVAESTGVETPAGDAGYPEQEYPATDEAFDAEDAPSEYTTETPEVASAPHSGQRQVVTGHGTGTGRRKEAVARVRIFPGTGQWKINGRPLDAYFPNKVHQQIISEPFVTLGAEGQFDVVARIGGGGTTGQAGALRLGIARALTVIDPENRPALKKTGFLTRDARVKERKKYGLKKARKAPQYSKR